MRLVIHLDSTVCPLSSRATVVLEVVGSSLQSRPHVFCEEGVGFCQFYGRNH